MKSKSADIGLVVGAFQTLHNMVGLLPDLDRGDSITALGVTDVSAAFWSTRG